VLSTKLQHPISKETSTFKIPKKPTHDQLLELDVWSFFGCWSLEFGASHALELGCWSLELYKIRDLRQDVAASTVQVLKALSLL
jgi:hypothetical protein